MDKPSDRLKQIREKRGFKTASAAAKRFGWTPSAYVHHENGTRPLTRVFKRYAAAFRVAEAWLRCLSDDQNSGVRGAPVIGEAATGVWRDESVETRPQYVGKIIDIPARAEKTEKQETADLRFSILVADNSVDRSLPIGWFAICEPLSTNRSAGDFSIGEMLYVERIRRGLKEMSLRRVSAKVGDKLKLSTHSTDKKWRQDMNFPCIGEKVRIVGRVVGKYSDYIPD